MGSIVGKAMDENMKKQQEFMVQNQSAMLERQIQMQNYMREQGMAMQMARARDMFYWWSAFYGVAVFAGLAGYARSRHPGALVPLVPLTFIWGYQADMTLGDKMDRIRNDADKILQEEGHLVALPQDLPTVKVLDERRQQSK